MSAQAGISRRALLGLFSGRAPSVPAATPVASSTPVRPEQSAPVAASAAAPTPVRPAQPVPVVARSVASGPVPHASEPTQPKGFSLEAFYSAREQSGEGRTGGRIPVFSLREGLAVPQEGVSRIGMAPTAPTPAGAPAAIPIAAGHSAAPTAGMTVRVRPQLCLAWQGSFCSTCSERCPVEGAITVELGRPRVMEQKCNGCGLCVQVCPAPLNGFEFIPSRAEAAP